MNILHIKYAVEVAKAGSINKASETLFIAQPNLSRSIKELEADLGITIFDRSAKGMFLTPEGEEFIGYAKKILGQIDEVERMYKGGAAAKRRFSASVPRATYIAEAFTRFSKSIGAQPAEIFYKETNSSRTIKNILTADYKLGIVRYAQNYDRYFKDMFAEKNLKSELMAEFKYVLVMSGKNPLSALPEIRFDHLTDYIEIAHADPYVPSLPLSEVKKEELPDNIYRRIFVFERASQFTLLSENTETFMWMSPLPRTTLERYSLVQRECPDNKKIYRDVLIYPENYRLTELDNRFIEEVRASRERCVL